MIKNLTPKKNEIEAEDILERALGPEAWQKHWDIPTSSLSFYSGYYIHQEYLNRVPEYPRPDPETYIKLTNLDVQRLVKDDTTDVYSEFWNQALLESSS